jgi:hypothetical protein
MAVFSPPSSIPRRENGAKIGRGCVKRNIYCGGLIPDNSR